MNKIAYHLTYYIIYVWMFLHALLPLSLLYILSDILYVVVYHIAGYRKKVVRTNLKNSFPEKSREELLTIEKKFYHHFCDYFVETIKLLHISDKEMQKRLVFENVDQIKEAMKDGNSGLLFMGHYANWEWVTSMNLLFTDGELLAQIYKPLKNKAFDDLFLKIRSRFKSIGIPKNDTLRVVVKLRREKQRMLIGFMADQSPSINNIHYWSTFLNQDSPIFTGVERIAKQTGFAVFYLDLQKIKRGYYKGTVHMISDKPQDEPEFAITERYIRAMEKTISRDPAYWLWTHKRWKMTREKVRHEREKQHKKHID